MSLPSSLSSIPHIEALDQVVADRIDNFPVEVVMTFLMQILPESALTTMADDFLVNGIGGFAQANSTQERRNVLLNAIRTRRRMGTVGAVKRAIQTLGYSEPEILEGYGNAPVVHDGSILHNGTLTHSGGDNGWAQFVVILPELELTGLTTEQVNLLVDYINYYKNERSELVGVGYYESAIPLHDGLFLHDGTADHSGSPANTIIFVT